MAVKGKGGGEGGATVSSESVNKGRFGTKIFLQIMLSEVLKICQQWCQLNDVKTSIKQQEIKDLVSYLTSFDTRINYLGAIM